MLDNIKELLIKDLPFYKKDTFTHFLNWKDLEHLLNFRPILNVNRFNVTNKEGYRWPEKDWLTDKNTFPPNIVKKEIKENVCYICDCSRYNKTINQICNDIEKITNHSTDAHIFFSLDVPSNTGLGIHNDISNNLIIQQEGQTRFKVWKEQETEYRRYPGLTFEKEPILDVILNKGDCVYIPRYNWHQAIPITKRLSVSFPMMIGHTNHQEREWIEI